MNKLSTTGRLVNDPELKDVNGRQCATFRFASNNKMKDKDTGKYCTNFYTVTCWGATADIASKFLRKGHRAGVTGDLVLREYVGSDNQKHFTADLNNADVDLLETATESQNHGAAQPVYQAAPVSQPMYAPQVPQVPQAPMAPVYQQPQQPVYAQPPATTAPFPF